MPLDLLPPELIHDIANSLRHKVDLKNLRCVCKSVKSAIEPLVFSSLEISADSDNEQRFKRQVALLERLSGANTFAPYVRTLRIGEFKSPRRNSKRIANKNPDEETMYECAMKLERYFRRAIESLVNVRRVDWTIYKINLSWTYDDIVGCLSRMQFLSELSITYRSYCKDGFKLPIQDLECSNLVQISLVAWDFSDPTIVTATATLLARNAPSLRDLTLHVRISPRAVKMFESLLKQSSFPVVLRLRVLDWRNLSISEIPSGIDLRTLKTFQIDQMSDKGWRGLAAAHIRLRHLYVGNVTEAFLSYLASYEGGVEKLQFTGCSHPESDARLSAYFYQSVLPKHAATLRSIEIVGVIESDSGWVHKSDADMVFGTCHLLEELTVGVNYDEIDFNSPTNVLATSLRFAVAHPTLTEMTLYTVGHQMPRHVEQMTTEAILKTCFPGSVNRDLQVNIGVRLRFEIKPGSDRFILKKTAQV